MTLTELSQLYYLKKEVRRNMEHLDNMRSKCGVITAVSHSEIHTGKKAESQAEQYVVEVAALEEQIRNNIVRCIIEQTRLEQYISDISDSLTRQIFRLRFIEGLSWLRVAVEIGGGNTEDSVKKTCYRYLKRNGRKK